MRRTNLGKILRDANKVVPIGATFEHYKGDMYKVNDLIINEKTQKAMVVYSFFEDNSSVKFTRPIEEWYQICKDGNPRFQLSLDPTDILIFFKD